MSTDPKFVELTADVVRIVLHNPRREKGGAAVVIRSTEEKKERRI